MATLRFLLKRFVAQRLLGLAVVVTLAFSVGVLVAGPIYADAAREAILSSRARRRSPDRAERSPAGLRRPELRLGRRRTRSSPSGPSRFPLDQGGPPGAGHGPPRDARRSVRAHPRPRRPSRSTSRSAASPPARTGSSCTSRWRGASRVRPGDRRGRHRSDGTAAGARRHAAPTPRPDRDDPFWFGSQNPFPNRTDDTDSTQPQPAIVEHRHAGPRHAESWSSPPSTRGTSISHSRACRSSRRRRFRTSWSASSRACRRRRALSTVDLISGLGTLLDIVRQRIADLAVPILLVVFQIGAVTLAVLAGVGALALTRQGFELAVLHSRGFRRGVLLAAQAIQAGVRRDRRVPARAAPRHGPGGAREHRERTRSPRGGLPDPPEQHRPVARSRRRRGRRRDPPGALGPVRVSNGARGTEGRVPGGPSAARAGAGGAVRPAARRVRVPPVADRDATGGRVRRDRPADPRRPDPPAVRRIVPRAQAPAPGVPRLDSRIGRSRRLPRYLAGRRIGRSPGTGFAAALLLLLSMGLLVVSTSYRAIVLRNHEDAAHAQVGADWRVNVTPPDDVLSVIREMPP